MLLWQRFRLKSQALKGMLSKSISHRGLDTNQNVWSGNSSVLTCYCKLIVSPPNTIILETNSQQLFSGCSCTLRIFESLVSSTKV